MGLREMVQRRKELSEEQDELLKDSDRVALFEFVKKKLKTIFIGDLASFEKRFGKLWGQDQFQLTDQQKKVRDIWKDTRKEILDRGNDFIKDIERELEAYEVDRVGYHYEFDLDKDGRYE